MEQSTQEAIAELTAAREQFFQSKRSLAEMTKKHLDILYPDETHACGGWSE